MLTTILISLALFALAVTMLAIIVRGFDRDNQYTTREPPPPPPPERRHP